MASTTSRIRIIFDGSSQGLTDEAKKARAELKALENDSSKLAGKFETAFAKIGKSALGITAVTGAVHTVGAAVVALQNLAPAALILPGALLATGAAFATLKIGLSGVGDAIKSGDISKLAPEAGRAVVAIRGLSGEFTKLKTSVQGALFKGLAADIKSIGGTYLPILKEGLTGIAVRFNAVGHGLADALKSLGTQNDLRTILNGTAKSLDGLGVSAGAFAQGLLKLGAFGVAQFGNIGKAISGAAAAFNVWVSNGVATGSFQRFFDSAIAGFRSLGGIITNVGSIFASIFKGLSGGGVNDPLQSLVKLTGALKEFFKTAEAQGALKTLGDTFRVIADVTRTVLLEALKQLPPIIEQLGPPVQVIAKALGGALVDAIHVVGPLLTGIAAVLNGMGDALGPVAIGVIGLYGAIKLLTIASTVAGALSAIPTIISAIRLAAVPAAPALRILGTALLKAGAVTGLLVVADQLNQINLATAHGDPAKLDDMSHSLNNISGGLKEILSGDFAGIFDQINSQWQQTVDNFTTGQSDIGRIFGDIRRAINGINLTPIKFDTSPARADVEALLGEINRAAPQITINGNSNPAGFALQEVLREIAAGKGSVNIDGRILPAQDALKLVIGLINNGAGDVTINGETKPAGQALSDFLQVTNGSTGTVRVDGNADPATGKVTQVIQLADGSTGTVTIDGNPDPATGKTNGVIQYANGATGTITIDGNQTPANGKINATVTYANGSTGTIQVNANTGPAQSGIDSFIQRNDGRRITIFTTVLGSGGLASAGRLAAGGPVRGPGTGTSDTAGLFALSNGEHVWTAREVARAGGHAAIERLRAAVAAGQIPRLASGGSIPSTVGTAPLLPVVPVGEVAPQEVTVNVNLDGRPFAALVETTIARRDRNTRRTVTAGSGATF